MTLLGELMCDICPTARRHILQILKVADCFTSNAVGDVKTPHRPTVMLCTRILKSHASSALCLDGQVLDIIIPNG